MWHRDCLEEAFAKLDLSWRSPTSDVKVYVMLEPWDVVEDGVPEFEDLEEAERVQVGTWDSVFAGTLGWAIVPDDFVSVPFFEGLPVTWENDTGEAQIPDNWFVLNHTTDRVLFFKRFTWDEGVSVLAGGKLHFRPQIQGYALTST